VRIICVDVACVLPNHIVLQQHSCSTAKLTSGLCDSHAPALQPCVHMQGHGLP